MAETAFSLVDKLVTVSLKLWFSETLAQEPGADDKQVANAKRRISVLNLQRNALIEEGDVLIEKMMETGVAPKVFHQLKDYSIVGKKKD